MSKIKEIFFPEAVEEKRPVSRGEIEKFLQYLNSTGEENTQFDAKDIGKILDMYDRISLDKIKVELGKHISALANTSGGLLAIGIREDRDLEPKFFCNNYDLESLDLQLVQRAISTAVEPMVEFYVETVQMEEVNDKPKGILLVFIEQSMNPPHQVIHNRTYYFRHGESSQPAAHSLVQAMFQARKQGKLFVDLIKVGRDPKKFFRFLIKNQGNAPAVHTHIIINIYPRLVQDGKLLLTRKQIERTTDGMWNIKCFVGNHRKNYMKFRFRAQPSQIILPGVNEVLFDMPFESFPGAKVQVDYYCDGFEGHQEFEL